MDDALALCAVDLCGRPYLQFDCEFKDDKVGEFETTLVKEFFYAVSYSAAMNIHIKMLSGDNSHHMIEAIFKAFSKALDEATSMDNRIKDVLSTKGSL
jgi:imidazoleglycerol-phosphate dehydratase